MKTPTLPALLAGACALLVSAMPLRAAFLTGFETSSGYTTNASVIGVQDTSAPEGNLWGNVSGFSNSVTSSNVFPQTGLLSMRILDTSTSAGTAAALDLGSSVLDTSKPFTIQFSWAITETGGTPGAALNMWFGTAVNSLSQKNWTHVNYNSNTQALGVYVTNAGGTSSQVVDIGNYTTIANFGEYMTWSITIDPVLKKYTNVTISGSLGSIDATTTIQGVNGGVIPWISNTAGDPPFNLWFSTGGAATITAYVDNVSIIPEPTASMLALGAFILLASRFRRRASLS